MINFIEAAQGNYNESDNYGKKLNPDDTHGITDKSEIHKYIKTEMRDRLRDDRETVPNRIKQQIINESKTLNNPLWWIGL